jgi:hypothetical protein
MTQAGDDELIQNIKANGRYGIMKSLKGTKTEKNLMEAFAGDRRQGTNILSSLRRPKRKDMCR